MPLLSIDEPHNPWARALVATAPIKKQLPFFFVLATLGSVLVYYRLRSYTHIMLTTRRSQYAYTLIARVCGFKVIWIGETLDASPHKLVAFLGTHGAHIIACPNQHIQAGYLRIGVSGAKTKLMYPSIPEKNAQHEKHDGIIIGCDGAYAMDTGMGAFLKALALAQDILGPIRIRIGGTVHDQRAIAWLSKSLGLEKNLQIIPSTLSSWVRTCDMFVLPGFPDTPVPVSIISAQQAGCAIIATDTLAHKEFVQPRKTGMLIEAGNIDMLSQAMITLARDANLRAEFSKESVLFAQSVYTPLTW